MNGGKNANVRRAPHISPSLRESTSIVMAVGNGEFERWELYNKQKKKKWEIRDRHVGYSTVKMHDPLRRTYVTDASYHTGFTERDENKHIRTCTRCK